MQRKKLGLGVLCCLAITTMISSQASAQDVLLGDVNLDGSSDFLDIAPWVLVLSRGVYQAEADFDESGSVDFLDIVAWLRQFHLGGP